MRGVWCFLFLAFFSVPTSGTFNDFFANPTSVMGNLASTAQRQMTGLVQDGMKSVQKVTNMGIAATRVFGNIPLDKSPGEQIESLIGSVIHELVRQMPGTAPIADLDSDTEQAYVCGTGGTVGDLTTMKSRAYPIRGGNENVTKLGFQFYFEDFHINYKNFKLHSTMSGMMSGPLNIKFEDNEVEFIIQIPKPTKILSALQEQCVVVIKDFLVNYIMSPQVDFAVAESNFGFRKHAAEKKLTKSMQTTEEQAKIKEKIELKVPIELNRKLADSNSVICVDPELIQKVKEKEKEIAKQVMSETFKEYCGATP